MVIGGNMGTKSNRVTTFVGVLFLMAGGGFALWFGLRFWDLVTFSKVRENGLQTIEELRDKRPSDVSEASWELAMDWSRTAYLKVFSSVDNPTSKNLAVFTEDLDRIAKSQSGLQMIDNLWDGLARSGPYGADYVRRFYPKFKHSYSVQEELTGKTAEEKTDK